MAVCSNAIGQPTTTNKFAIELVDSAKLAFCNNDTAKTIFFLEKIERDYPVDGVIIMSNKILGELYSAMGRDMEAKSKFFYALSYKPATFMTLRDADICDKIINNYSGPAAKADLCVAISQLYLKQKQFDSSLYYLNLADNDYLPYRGCGNGVIMYKSFLSMHFADHYLAAGDTTHAISRLLDFFMKPDGSPILLTNKLKALLLHKWTQAEITNQVDQGFKNFTYHKTENGGYTISVNLFGHTVKDYCYGSIKSYKQFYKKDRSLMILKGE